MNKMFQLTTFNTLNMSRTMKLFFRLPKVTIQNTLNCLRMLTMIKSTKGLLHLITYKNLIL